MRRARLQVVNVSVVVTPPGKYSDVGMVFHVVLKP